MYNLKHNNYHLKSKNSNIYTPLEVSEFIYELLKDKIEKRGMVFDPCSGQGSLLMPWDISYRGNGYSYYPWRLFGIEIDSEVADKPGSYCNLRLDFFSLSKEDFKFSLPKEPALVLCNPPFNGAKPKLAPEIWLDKIIELFGKEVPIVLFAPIRLRLCSSLNSPRYQKWTNGTYPAISSIVSLPTTGIFKEVDFFTEILIFNIPGLKAHYFFKPNYE